jgi:hypothetical protein
MATPQQAQALARLQRYARLLDHSIRIPVIGYKIGINPILGLVPGIGDLAGLALSSYVLLEAMRVGVPSAVLRRMAFNVALETAVGTVPILGDIFDMTFKANMRNIRLLERAWQAAPASA